MYMFQLTTGIMEMMLFMKSHTLLSLIHRNEVDSSQSTSTSAPVNNYHCEICCKSFNGPKPYKAHMASRAHKEELELRSEGDHY